MTMKKSAALLLAVLSLSLFAFAHGDLEHVIGTVVKIDGKAVSVKVADGSIKVVQLDDQTHILKAGVDAKASDIQVGSRVVIHARKHEDSLQAVEVKIGVTTPAASHP
jgi:Cu/Ag efflux protein CusF